MAALDVRILGSLQVARDGTPVDLGGPKQRAVLAVLALRAGQPVRTSELAAAIWPDGSANGDGKRALQTYVSRLRSSLGADRIVTHPQGYELRLAPDELDLGRLRRSVAAAREQEPDAARADLQTSVPTGPVAVLSDLADALDCTDLIRTVEEEVLDAQEDLARAELAAGAPVEAVRRLEPVVAEHPLRESAWFTLLTALRHAGRQADALARYERLRRTLLEELGTEPSAALQRLHGELLDGADIGGPGAARRSTVRNPFKGLHPFGEEDAADFFGRDRLVAQTLELLGERGLVTLVGPSGSGKSSALRAGVVPAVRRAGLAGREGWGIATVPPDRTLPGAIEEARASAGEGPLLIVVDHLEELFGPTTDESTVDAVLAALRTTTDEPSVRVVAALRADRYDEPLRRSAFAATFLQGVVHVVPLTADELSEAITGPLRPSGIEVEPRLLATLLADLDRHPDGLPHLQHVLSELFVAREDDTLRLRSYRSLGGIEGALSRRAEEVHARLDPRQQATLQRIALAMVEATATGAERRRVRMSDLEDAGTEADVALVVERLARWRLLVRDRDPATGEPTVTFTHDTVLRTWGRLERWIDAARDDLRHRSALEASATLWDESGRPDGLLLVGEQLEVQEGRAASSPVPRPALVREFVTASAARAAARDEDDERVQLAERRARRRRAGTAVAAAAAALSIAGVLAWPAPTPTVVMVVDDEGGLSRLYLRGAESAERELGIDVHPFIRSDTDEALRFERLVGLCDDDILGVALSSHPQMARESATLTGCGVRNVVAFDVNPDWFAPDPEAAPFVAGTSFVHLDVAEGAFLAGLAAATESQTRVVGVVEALPIGPIQDFTTGFVQGAVVAGDDVEVVILPVFPSPWELDAEARGTAFAGAFSDPGNVERALAELVEQHGADVVLVLAGEAGEGALDAVTSYPDVWLVGADRDWQESGSPGAPRVLGSVLKATDVAALAAADLLHTAPDTPEVLRLGLAEGATAYLDGRGRSEASAEARRAWERRLVEEGLPGLAPDAADRVTWLDPLIPPGDL